MNKICVRAIVIGCLVDWGGTFAFTLASGLSLAIMAAVRGFSQQEIQSALSEWANSTPGMTLSLLYGSGFTFLGGYVASRLAESDHLLNSALVGVVGILFGLFFIPEVHDVISWVAMMLSIPVSMLGGFYHTRKLKLF
jgi:hypothetical protein